MSVDPPDRSAEVEATLEKQRRLSLLGDLESLQRVLDMARQHQRHLQQDGSWNEKFLEKNAVAIERSEKILARMDSEPDLLDWPLRKLRMVAGADVPQLLSKPSGERGRYWPDHVLQCPDFSVRVTVLSNGDFDLDLENERILPGHARMVNLPAGLLRVLRSPRVRDPWDLE